MDRKFLKLEEVLIITSVAKSTLKRMEERKEFPKRVKLSGEGQGARVGWVSSEVSEWFENKIKERDAAEVYRTKAVQL